MAEVFRHLSRKLLDAGNPIEAGIFRSAEKERIRRVYVAEKIYGKAILYLVWRVTSGYGESLTKWIWSCSFVIGLFSILYYLTRSISPIAGSFDYVYFSIVTFTTLGFGDIVPSGLVGKLLSCLEVAAGISMFGILLSFMGNRFQR
jgi:hypothetical protein